MTENFKGHTPGERLARRFHEAYERLAPTFGYETREETKEFDPTSPNGRLMIAVAVEVESGLLDERDENLEALRVSGKFQGHTPGPWEVQQLNHADGDLWLQVGYNGRGPIARTSSPAEPMGGAVAEFKYLVTSEKEQLANARLVAAAPDLLRQRNELAKIARRYLDESRAVLSGELGSAWADHCHVLFNFMYDLEAALAKIEEREGGEA